MSDLQVVSRDEWLTARKRLLVAEEEAAGQMAALGEARRALPVEQVEKEYVFDGPDGRADLHDLFEGRGQLIIYHFMFDPEWDAGCKFCSYLVDNIGNLTHMHTRDTTIAVVSRAPLAKIEEFKARMGWTLPWYSSYGNDFNYDFHVTIDESVAPIEYNYRTKAELVAAGEDRMLQGEQSGLSVFVRRDGAIYHTYSTYADGALVLHGIDNYLEFTPAGRPQGDEMFQWLRHHDAYDPPLIGGNR